MKKLLLSLGLMLSLSVPVFADNVNVDDLNKQIKTILAPLQNQNTSASITFQEIDVDSVRANNFAVNGHYHKKSSDNHFDIDVDNLQYKYGDGTAPLGTFAGSIKVDWTKIIPQELINEIISGVPEFIESLADNTINNDYGDAISIKSVMTATNKDSHDNYTGFSAIISINIDLNKLPQDALKEEVPFTNLVLSVSMDVKSGTFLNAYVVMNPAYEKYEEDQEGLKELLEKLIANDEDTIEDLTSIMFFFDELAGEFLEGNFIVKNVMKFLHK